MYIAIPVENNNGLEAKITTINDAKHWAIVEFEEGVIKNINFVPSWQESGVDWLDFVILENKFENYLDFLNEGYMVLVRRKDQESIEELIEAFKFKELDEAGL